MTTSIPNLQPLHGIRYSPVHDDRGRLRAQAGTVGIVTAWTVAHDGHHLPVIAPTGDSLPARAATGEELTEVFATRAEAEARLMDLLDRFDIRTSWPSETYGATP